METTTHPMHCLSWDYETTVTTDVSLKRLPLRTYLKLSPVLCVSWAADDDTVDCIFADDPQWVDWVEEARRLAERPDWCFNAHNNGFDARVGRYGWSDAFGPLAIPQPKVVHCSLELAMAAWPNQAGGYGLANLSRVLGLPPKLEIDLKGKTLATMSRAQRDAMRLYCMRDTENSREIRRLALERLPDCEVHVAEMANRVRRNHFILSHDAVEAAVVSFAATAKVAVAAALEALEVQDEEDKNTAFGWDGDEVRSVKPAGVKELLLMNLGFTTPTISIKKINPARMMQSEQATAALREVGRANKSLSHKRRCRVFRDVAEVDMELGYARAHTYRYSSPSVGKGVNLHNLPKHDKAIAKPIRKLFTLPSDLCFVRADAANVEYRTECWLLDAAIGHATFADNILADPYAAFWKAATGQLCSKKENVPARQLAKAAVLGLGYKMGVGRWMVELAKFIADPINKVTLAHLIAIIAAQGWKMPNDRWVKGQRTKYAIPEPVAIVAYHTRQLFHRIHPEFFAYGHWIEELVIDVARAINPERAIDGAYKRANAPDRNKIDIIIDPELDRPTLRLILGPWNAPTVAWRDIGVHPEADGVSAIQAGNKGYRTLTQNILLENTVQSAARNAMVMAKIQLEARGWECILSVHDELLIICPRDRASVLRCRTDILAVMGPGGTVGWDYAFVCDPAEISVSQSMWEEEQKPEWWAELESGNDALLLHLP